MSFSIQLNWQANPDEQLGDFTPIPEGWYFGAITEMTVKAKQNKPDENTVEAIFTIDEGAFKGRQLFDNINLWETSEKAQEFVKRKLNTLVIASGQQAITDLNQIIAKRMAVKVTLQEAREQVDPNTGVTKKFNARNQIQTYKSVQDAMDQAAATGGSALPSNFGSGQSPSAPPPNQAANVATQQQQPAFTNQAPVQQQAAPVQQQAAVQQQPAQQAQPAVGGGAPAAGNVPPWMQPKQ